MANLELATEKSAAKSPVKAANEDTPTGGALYRMIARRPSKRIPAVALVASFFCLGCMAAYLGGVYGPEGLKNLPQETIILLGAVLLVPLFLIWLTAYAIWRGQEMRLMAEALAHTAIRLTDPADAAAGEVATIAAAVEAELKRMKAGLAEALAETTKLRDLVSEDLEAIDQGSTRAEMRAARLEELITHHHDSLTELGRMMGQEADTVSRGLRGQVEAVRGLIGQAEKTLNEAGTRVVAETETLARVSEAARAGADSTASTLDRQASRLEVVANTALSKADELTSRYETQRQILADASNNLSAEGSKLETLFETHRDHMAEVGSTVSERTKEISDAAETLAKHVKETFDLAAERAKTVRAEIAGEITAAVSEVSEASGNISRSSGAATRAIGATVEELRAAATALTDDLATAATEAITTTTDDLRIATNAMTSEVTRATAALSENISERTHELRDMVQLTLNENDVAAERFNAAMIRLGGTAREAGNALDHAASDLEARMALLPEEAAAGAAQLTQVLQDQVSALAAIADIVVRHARVLDRSAPMPAGATTPSATGAPPAPTAQMPMQSMPVPPPRVLSDMKMPATPAPQQANPQTANRGWGIPDLLAAAGRMQETANAAPPAPAIESESEFQRSSLQIIETLQALAVDLDRALEQSPSPELWQRYQAGERNVFARRLYNMAGRQLYDRIGTKYRAESEFREHVDRFIDLFERLLAQASARDRDNILVETYLTSDTGKVYLMLAQTSGRLA
tara:strand:- start:49540 stop:51795 length:2256 start_codon:yes stop_codon:yes gene_type:complete